MHVLYIYTHHRYYAHIIKTCVCTILKTRVGNNIVVGGTFPPQLPSRSLCLCPCLCPRLSLWLRRCTPAKRNPTTPERGTCTLYRRGMYQAHTSPVRAMCMCPELVCNGFSPKHRCLRFFAQLRSCSAWPFDLRHTPQNWHRHHPRGRGPTAISIGAGTGPRTSDGGGSNSTPPPGSSVNQAGAEDEDEGRAALARERERASSGAEAPEEAAPAGRRRRRLPARLPAAGSPAEAEVAAAAAPQKPKGS